MEVPLEIQIKYLRERGDDMGGLHLRNENPQQMSETSWAIEETACTGSDGT